MKVQIIETICSNYHEWNFVLNCITIIKLLLCHSLVHSVRYAAGISSFK